MKLAKYLLVLIAGALLGISALYILSPSLLTAGAGGSASESDDTKPLYWVAPMDPNYRRDGPGKSPMGMDLIPVYAKDQQSGNDSPGTIEISPEVINNLSVRTVSAASGQLQHEVRTVGYLQYNQDSIVHIHPRVEGWVEKSFVTSVGDPVTKGQKLYTLYSPALVNAQEELLFGLKRKDQRMQQAAEARLRALHISDGFINQLKKSGTVSQTVTFYAPTSGVVDNLNIRDGFYVKPGMTLLSIASLDQIWLEAEVLERQASLIREALPVEVRLDFLPGEVLQGQVDYVYPALDAQTRTLRVRVRLDNKDHALRPNMFAELKITASDNQERLLIPKEAVIRGGQQDRVVLALGEGRFKSIAVKTGQRDNQYVEIIEGLKNGEQVVSSAQFLLDSESSRTSDFARIDAVQPTDTQPPEKPSKVWVKARVASIDASAMKLNAQHDAIPEWSWPAMQMDFQIDEFVDLDELPTDKPLHLEVTRTESGGYLVTDFFVPDAD